MRFGARQGLNYVNPMRTFHLLVVNTLVASVTNNFLWFALTFWVYLETRSVLATAVIGGGYMLLLAVSGIVLGTFVDQHRRRTSMLLSSALSLAAFVARRDRLPDGAGRRPAGSWPTGVLGLHHARACRRDRRQPPNVALRRRSRCSSPRMAVIGRTASSERRTASRSRSRPCSAASPWAARHGLVRGIAVALRRSPPPTCSPIRIDEPAARAARGRGPQVIDFRGAIHAVRLVPGLLALLLFTTFNNFLGGVFMALMDPYGLTLVSVEAWGILLAITSLGFIVGGVLVARRGLGRNPVRTLLLVNVVLWTITILFPIRSDVLPLAIGFFLYMLLIPVAEASEQTIIQKVVPFTEQGRVFGFAQSLETAAAPITAFLIGPIAQFWIIPAMTDGALADLIGSWFGTGPARAMALIFIVAGTVGLLVTLAALRSRPYRELSSRYAAAPPDDDAGAVADAAAA